MDINETKPLLTFPLPTVESNVILQERILAADIAHGKLPNKDIIEFIDRTELDKVGETHNEYGKRVNIRNVGKVIPNEDLFRIDFINGFRYVLYPGIAYNIGDDHWLVQLPGYGEYSVDHTTVEVLLALKQIKLWKRGRDLTKGTYDITKLPTEFTLSNVARSRMWGKRAWSFIDNIRNIEFTIPDEIVHMLPHYLDRPFGSNLKPIANNNKLVITKVHLNGITGLTTLVFVTSEKHGCSLLLGYDDLDINIERNFTKIAQGKIKINELYIA